MFLLSECRRDNAPKRIAAQPLRTTKPTKWLSALCMDSHPRGRGYQPHLYGVNVYPEGKSRLRDNNATTILDPVPVQVIVAPRIGDDLRSRGNRRAFGQRIQLRLLKLALARRHDVKLSRLRSLIVLSRVLAFSALETEAEVLLLPAPSNSESSRATLQYDGCRLNCGVVQDSEPEIEHEDHRISLEKNLRSELFEILEIDESA